MCAKRMVCKNRKVSTRVFGDVLTEAGFVFGAPEDGAPAVADHSLLSAFDPKRTGGSGLVLCKLTREPHFASRKSLL